MESKLYNYFMDIIGNLSNDDIEKLANALLEYVKNDEEF